MPNLQDALFPRHKERFEDRLKETDERKLRNEFFDHPTLLAISRLVTQGEFETIDFPVATGKEGGVFRASGPGGFRAVKVYRIGNAVFRHLPAYALEELKRESSERNYARLIYAWTRREHTILRKLRAAGVRVPEPSGYLRNVLVMEFVGSSDGVAAPRLHDAQVDDVRLLYEDVVGQMRKMSVDARLVHGDLSPYNILWHEGHPVLIDVAQSVSAEHPQAKALFERDAANFVRYLNRQGLALELSEFLEAAGFDAIGPKVA